MEVTRMSSSFKILVLLLVQISYVLSAECPSFRDFFSKCTIGSNKFDDCLNDALNKARPCLQYGDPLLNIPVLEPIKYAEIGDPITATAQSSLFTLKITLPNITEWGWANSTYYKVKSDFNKKKLVIYQEVPYKHVISAVTVSGEILGVPLEERMGHMVLDMFGVRQRYTIQMLPNSNRLKVNLVVLQVKDVKLALDDFTKDQFIGKVVKTAILRFWRIGYDYFKIFAYDMSDKAKTILANRLYNTVNLESLFTPAPKRLVRRH